MTTGSQGGDWRDRASARHRTYASRFLLPAARAVATLCGLAARVSGELADNRETAATMSTSMLAKLGSLPTLALVSALLAPSAAGDPRASAEPQDRMVPSADGWQALSCSGRICATVTGRP